MQHCEIFSTRTYFGNNLSAFNFVSFSDQQFAVVAISAQEICVVLNYHQLPVTTQAAAGVHDYSVRRTRHRVPQSTSDINALADAALQ